MAQIIPAGQLNIAALNSDDLYINIVNPPAYIVGVPTDVFGVVGTASWGPVNVPVSMGNSNDATNNFGSISAVSLTDPYDLATDLFLTFGQAASSASLEGWGVRVSDGTDTAASIALAGTAADTEILTVTAPGSVGTLYSVNILQSAVSIAVVTYTSVTGDTATTVAQALTNRINANAAFAAVGINAVVGSGLLDVYYPSTLTLTWTLSTNITNTAGSTVTAAGTITARYSGVLGNQIVVAAVLNAANGKYNVSVQTPFGVAEAFTGLPATGFYSALQNALNNGISGLRGPSLYVKMASANGAVGVSAFSSTLAGGTDGRANVTTASLVGQSSTFPNTGLQALANLNPAVSVAWLAGCTDPTAAPTLAAFGAASGACVLESFPVGETTSAALAAALSAGVGNADFTWVTDWIYFFDPFNNQNRLVPPTPVIAGTICCLTPEQSPGNKQVNLVLGTYRNNPVTGNVPYSPSEIGQLETAGIMFISNPIPAGQVFGIRHGQTTSPNAATKPFEYWRMTSYLARSIADSMGSYVDQLQSQQPQDPLRAAIKLELNNFFSQLEGLGQIDQFLVTCTFSASPSATPGLGMNTPASIAQHYLFVLVQVTYLSSVRFFVVSLQGGTTVVAVQGGLSGGSIT